ncbi:MAG: GAF domain-containing protein [Anaerolineales bacterium]
MRDRLLEMGRLQEEVAWRQQVFAKVTRVSAFVEAGLFVLFVTLGLLDLTIPAWPLAGVALAGGWISLLSMWLNRRGRLQPAIVLYLVGVMLTTFASINMAGGVTGPLVIFLMVVPMLAGQVGGGVAVRWSTAVVIFFWAVAVALESFGVVTPLQVPDPTVRVVHYGMFLFTLLFISVIVSISVRRAQQGMVTAYERERELAESTRVAQAAAEAEREAREREARAVAHIREMVAEYVTYLSQVAAGNYAVQLDVGELDEELEGARELGALGEYLNATVDRLVELLTETQSMQRRYTAQSWEAVLETGRAEPGFAYRRDQIVPTTEWLPQMRKAVNSGGVVSEGESAAVPLVINRQVVGALGGQHPEGRPWTEEELALIEDVSRQLAQTIESLRLFDDVQRRAAREQLVGQVTGRIRETLDMETMLQTATEQLRRALDLEDLIVQLATPEALDDQSTR